MKILSHQFLCGWLLRHILSKNTQFIQRQPAIIDTQKQSTRKRKKKKRIQTRGGRHSSACRLSTENPPWVLVSDAVRVLQKEWTWNRGGGGGGGSFSTAFSSCYIIPPHIKKTKKIISIITFSPNYSLSLSETHTNERKLTFGSGSKVTWANTSSVSGSAWKKEPFLFLRIALLESMRIYFFLITKKSDTDRTNTTFSCTLMTRQRILGGRS